MHSLSRIDPGHAGAPFAQELGVAVESPSMTVAYISAGARELIRRPGRTESGQSGRKRGNNQPRIRFVDMQGLLALMHTEARMESGAISLVH
jgi:hypothetical protein